MAAVKKNLIITSTFPIYGGKTGEIKEEADKKFPYEVMGATVLAWVVWSTLEGAKSVVVVEPPEGKLEEYIDHVNQRQLLFARGSEGYKFQVQVCTDTRIP